MTQIRLQVLTPDSLVLDEPVDEVVAPIPDGWIGVLAGHTPFQARLLRGELAFRCGDVERVVVTLGGTIGVTGHAVTVLTGAARTDATLDELEAGLDEQVAEFHAVETEAEKHFSRVYRTLADTFSRDPARKG